MPRTRRGAVEELAPDGRRLYSLGDVQLHVQVSRPQAQYWLKHKLIVPDYQSPGGTGNYHGFSFRNLVEFAVLRWMAQLGSTMDRMKVAVESLRSIDPDDWFSAMPRMRAQLDALPRRRRPTKKQALMWLDRHMNDCQYTDPEWVAEFGRHAEVARLYAPDAALDDDDAPPVPGSEEERKLVLWREFKDPTTRKADAPPVVLCSFFIAFSASEVYDFIGKGVPVVLVPLTKVFERLEARTGDSWNKVTAP